MTTWIKRSEVEPPKDTKTFLVATKHEVALARWSRQRWSFVIADGWGTLVEFTHWAPIPKLPEEKE